MGVNLSGRSFLRLLDFTTEEIEYMLALAKNFKDLKRTGTPHRYLEGKNIVLLFQKTSTRTRCAFEVGGMDLGMGVTYLDPGSSQMGKKESIEDTARVLGRMYDGIEFRGFAQDDVEELAAKSGVPVWNGLTTEWHPTQMLADILTVQENFNYDIKGKTLVFMGDCKNNVARSLMVVCSKLGMNFVACGPEECMPADDVIEACKPIAEANGCTIKLTTDVKDGVAVCRFLYWLKTCVGYEEITERSAAAKLESFRAEQADYLGASFDPIAAYGAHAAIVHYDPAQQAEETCLAPRGLCLFDTGGHYLQGTTDITRTVALGPVTADERRLFTLVLRGHLRLSQARFPQGAVGQDLDILARQPLWERGLDFLHGTGHGVGYVLSVHEGPQRLHWRFTPGSAPCALQAGMVISNEPGYYQAGAFGIRHENLLLVRPSCETEYGAFLRFENLTMVPFDRDAIDPALLTAEERAALNRYHRAVWETISPHLAGDERAWLKAATEAL